MRSSQELITMIVQICLSFYEIKNKQSTWFGNNKVERLYWEHWYINLHVINPKAHGKSHHNKATTDLGGRDSLFDVLLSLRAFLLPFLHVPSICFVRKLSCMDMLAVI